MIENEFFEWLLANYPPTVAQTRLANCKNVEKYEGNLEQHFANDKGQSLLEKLSYSTNDQRNNRPPKHKIPINGDIRTGSSTLKSACTLYFKFKLGMGTKPSEGGKPKNCESKTHQSKEASNFLA